MDRRLLAKVDRRLLSEMDHTEGVQLVKVPVSDAVWSTWRRYCDAVGVSMGRGLAVLLQRELAAVVDEDLEGALQRGWRSGRRVSPPGRPSWRTSRRSSAGGRPRSLLGSAGWPRHRDGRRSARYCSRPRSWVGTTRVGVGRGRSSSTATAVPHRALFSGCSDMNTVI